MTEKQEYIIAYITNLAVSLNIQYPKLLPTDRVQEAINMFKDSPKELPEIVADIDNWKENLIREYLMVIQNSQMSSNENSNQNTNIRQEEIEHLQDLRKNISELNPVNENQADEKGKEQAIGKQKRMGTYPKQKLQNSGFASGLLFTLLFGMASGAILTISYILSNIDKYTFMIK